MVLVLLLRHFVPFFFVLLPLAQKNKPGQKSFFCHAVRVVFVHNR